MRDAMGGVVNLVIIVVFLVIVSGYLAFNVNYTRAFRVKNKIISSYEQYSGNCDNDSTQCMKQIIEYMEQIGYDMNQKIEYGDYKCRRGRGFCTKQMPGVKDDAKKEIAVIDDRERVYYKVVTQVTIDIPIINRIMQGLDTFKIKGDTKTIILE